MQENDPQCGSIGRTCRFFATPLYLFHLVVVSILDFQTYVCDVPFNDDCVSSLFLVLSFDIKGDPPFVLLHIDSCYLFYTLLSYVHIVHHQILVGRSYRGARFHVRCGYGLVVRFPCSFFPCGLLGLPSISCKGHPRGLLSGKRAEFGLVAWFFR